MNFKIDARKPSECNELVRSLLGRLPDTVLYNCIMKNEFYIAFNHFLPWEYLIEIHL